MPALTASSARVKAARQLLLAKHRRASGLFLADGPQAVREALVVGAALEVFVEIGSESRWAALVARRSADIPVHVVEAHGFAGLSETNTPQGIIATCRWRQPDFAEFVGRDGSGQLALAHEMSDPGNAGALIRVADAAGARAVALSWRSVDPTNSKCVRSSAGSVFHLPILAAGHTREAIASLQAHGWRTVAADVTPDARDLYSVADSGLLDGRIAWIFGNEAHGLPEEILGLVDQVVRIPIFGRAESLNLATAAALCLYAAANRANYSAIESGRQ